MRPHHGLVRVRSSSIPSVKSFLCQFDPGQRKLTAYGVDRGVKIFDKTPGPWSISKHDKLGFDAKDGTYLEILPAEASHAPISVQLEKDKVFMRPAWLKEQPGYLEKEQE